MSFVYLEGLLRGKSYCNILLLNMEKVNAQHNARTIHISKEANKNKAWVMHKEAIPSFRRTPIKSKTPLELIDLTKDTTDYAWYTTK